MDSIRSKREGLILAQFEFLKTRQEAMERVLTVAPWYLRLSWALWPSDFLRAVDAVQMALIEQSKADMKKAAAPKIETVPLVVPCGR